MSALTLASSTTVELARWQFATTAIYHFIFVPLTLGLGPLVAVMQTLWYRSGDERWLRLTRFFGTLLVINVAVGVASGLVMEFQFGMNWSVFSRYVGDVFGAPLAIEGLGAFILEATFIGLWLFGWSRLSPRVHLATIYVVWLGSWLSAWFILAANSWMQHPVGYEVDAATHRAHATNVFRVLFQPFTLFALGHAILAGVMAGSFFCLGVACWHVRRGRNVELFRSVAKLAVVVALPVSAFNMGLGSEFGVLITDRQPMKIAATEAIWDTCSTCSFSLFQFGGFSPSHPKPWFSIEIPGLLSFLATNSFTGTVEGMKQVQAEEVEKYGPGSYTPDVPLVYWSMRGMAYVASLSLLIAAWGAWLLHRRKLIGATWFHRAAIAGIALPFVSAIFGWILSESGRQPWVVYGLLRTEDAVSPTTSAWTVALSLGAFVALYVLLAGADFWLMRRYARLDPPEADAAEGKEGAPAPAPSY